MHIYTIIGIITNATVMILHQQQYILIRELVKNISWASNKGLMDS
jgi:hypothetical protein